MTKGGKNKSSKKGYYILRAWITTKDGKKIYARDYGKRAFPIWITR